jgi:hypothetical protein
MNLKHKNVLKRHFSKKKYTRKIVQKENMQGKGKKNTSPTSETYNCSLSHKIQESRYKRYQK